MPRYVAQLVFQGSTGLPRDRFVNTFNFNTSDAHEAAHAGWHDAMVDFVNTVDPDSGKALGAYMSHNVQSLVTIKTYNQLDAAPRVPITSTFSRVASSTDFTTNVPHEVACCLSYHGLPPVGPRTRGRLYLGPFNAMAMSPASGATPPSVSLGLRWCAGAAAERLVVASKGWIVRSDVGNLNTPVERGWVDNDWDIQRRRGMKATERTPWDPA
uniref:Uncharacterized protein n=1 Tax=uncultured prokaryote TaxID=198431 RepID=A0A0H5Q2W3_9ZZZZ|nr:hypothetical protein [uncultured prokaryote]